MRLKTLGLAFAGLMAWSAMSPAFTTYSGELIWDAAVDENEGEEDCLVLGPNSLNNPPTLIKFRYDVTDFSTYWNYKYTITWPTAQAFGLSHWIFEVSPGFSTATINNPDLYDLTVNGTVFQAPDIKSGPGNAKYGLAGNPGMPGEMYGVKFNRDPSGAGSGTMVVEFKSQRVATWGDVYFKGGNVGVWNAGFGNGEAAGLNDPTPPSYPLNLAPHDAQCHALVPDSVRVPPQGDPDPIPEPGTLALLGLGLGAVIKRRKRVG